MQAPARHIFAEKAKPKLTNISPLRRLSDKYADGIAEAVEQVSGRTVDVIAQDVRFLSYGDWSNGLNSLSSLSIFRLLPLRGLMILHLEEVMINTLVELYFGGTLGPLVARKNDCFRKAELQLIGRLQDALFQQLGICFSDYAIMKPALQSHESSALHVTICKPDEQVMRQSFDVSIEPDISWQIDVIYSPDAAESAIELVQSKSIDQSEASDPLWQQQWFNGLQNIHLPLRTILAQPVMPLPDLFEMKPGDIIPITPRVKPPLFVANHKFANGTLGEKNGCAAFKIEHIIRGNT